MLKSSKHICLYLILNVYYRLFVLDEYCLYLTKGVFTAQNMFIFNKKCIYSTKNVYSL